MTKMHFGRGPGETAEPSILFLRTLSDGTSELTVIEGDDKHAVIVAKLLVKMINKVGFEDFLPMARAVGEQAGLNTNAMLAEIKHENAKE